MLWIPEFCILGTPLIVVIAWWVRRRERHRLVLREWRSKVAGIGVLASSLNVAVFYGLMVWAKLTTSDDGSMAYWAVRNVLGNWVALPLLAVVLFGAMFGEGRVRALLVASALTGFFMWVPVAIL
jgi:hypothetical protein